MFKRKTRSAHRSQILQLSGSNRGSDIIAPNSTSLQVNRSQVTDERESTEPSSENHLLSDDENDFGRPSTSIMTSMIGKVQSTPGKNRNSHPLSSLNSLRLDLSKRKTPTKSDTQLSKISKRVSRTPQKKPTLYFLQVLQDCGADEIVGEGSFILSEDQAVLAMKLNRILKGEGDLERFIQSFNDYAKDLENLKKLVLYTETSNECSVARGPVQEPMMRLLLLVDCIQSRLLQILLEKMAMIAIDNQDKEGTQLISSILRQTQCLNRVEDTKFGCKLFELIEVSTVSLQKEIIFLLPELIVEDEMEYAATQLVDLLQGGTELTPFIVDSLSNLPLSKTLKADVWSKVVSKLNKCSPTYLPNLTQFAVSRCENEDVQNVVTALRENLPFTISLWEQRIPKDDNEKAEFDSAVKQTFENFKVAFMASKNLTDGWMKVIANLTSSDDFRPLDLVMLVMIHGYVLGKKPTVLTLVKNKIRSGVLTEKHIHYAFKILNATLLENYKEVLELASGLLKSFENNIASIGVCLYLEAFSVFGTFQRQEIICDVLHHVTTGNSSVISNGLSLLTRLRDGHSSEMENYASFLLSALRKIPDLDLSQVRQLMDVIGSLVTAESQQLSGLLEEVQIFVRKHISAWQLDAQKKGIVAAVTLVKFVVGSSDSSSILDSEEANNLESDFLLKMAQGPLNGRPARCGFFYDELATVIRELDLQQGLLSSWRDRIYNIVTQQIFGCNFDIGCDDFPMTLQYSMDSSDNLVLPIVAYVVKPSSSGSMNPLIIPAALRLLWSSEQNFSRLSSIMTASVILPDVTVFDNFLSYQPSQQKSIMDCLFLCANYFIECINALSTQKINEKLMIRLKQLIEVRKRIEKHVGEIPQYEPPPCQFHYDVVHHPIKIHTENKKPGRGRKRKSDGTQANDTVNQSHLPGTCPLPSTSTAAPSQAIARIPSSSESTNLCLFSGYFRELYCHAYKLLRMELKLNPTKVFKKKKMSDLIACDDSWSYRPEDKPELGPSDAVYLLQDYMMKSELILKEHPPFLIKKTTSLVVETVAPSTFLLGSVKLLPKFCLKLEVVSGYCKDLLEANEGVWDSPGVFPSGSEAIKLTFVSILKIFVDILSWRGLESPIHQSILKDALTVLARKNSLSSTQSIGSLAVGASRYIASHSSAVPLLSGAVSIVRAVQSILRFSSDPKDLTLVGELCEEFLQRPWFTVSAALERGTQYNQKVDSLLRTYLSSVPNRLEVVHRTTELVAEEITALTGKDAALNSFKTITKNNFPLLYRAICEALVSAVTEELSKCNGDEEKSIEVWGTVTRTLRMLVEIAKVHTSRTNLAALLKRSQAIIQQFLSKGLPVMEVALRTKSEDVLKVLKCLQAVTRFLHSVCCHSKVTSDGVVAAHVPAIRSLCERLTLEVKGMLILNKIPLDCITIAVLKNRDIQGNDIMSQTTIATSDDESELPPEEDTTDPPDPQEIETDVPVTEDSTSDLF